MRSVNSEKPRSQSSYRPRSRARTQRQRLNEFKVTIWRERGACSPPPPSSPEQRQWQTSEFDLVGEYSAQYSQLRGNAIVRRKEQYLRISGDSLRPIEAGAALSVHSEDRFSLDDRARVVALSGLQQALAGVCQAARASNPALATDTQRALEAELTASRAQPEKLAVVLRALGRCGHPGSIALLRPYLSHRSPLVQAAATDALGT